MGVGGVLNRQNASSIVSVAQLDIVSILCGASGGDGGAHRFASEELALSCIDFDPRYINATTMSLTLTEPVKLAKNEFSDEKSLLL